ncbi:nuclear transport factor 2 family protein [Paracoccus tegillarcae]|uniref:Polyketide cyclase n=1 Tax=Paracoccus tegillarcae TaxID=1529068 RepID=A0A2K9F5Q9_9RHOB|nr:nuclear transport factor 2 family protein [Paracoccus tegillarcae]AUH34521.1 polyketide cyclase [Paracoccus tegillarcae]
MSPEARLVRDFWQAMNANDWAGVAERYLAHDFTGLWPQSAEIIDGRDQFVAVNGAFPGQGGWQFEVITLLSEGEQVVSDTRVTQLDLQIVARVITFHRIRNGLIAQQTEFWPDPYPVPEWRSGLLATDPQAARF